MYTITIHSEAIAKEIMASRPHRLNSGDYPSAYVESQWPTLIDGDIDNHAISELGMSCYRYSHGDSYLDGQVRIVDADTGKTLEMPCQLELADLLEQPMTAGEFMVNALALSRGGCRTDKFEAAVKRMASSALVPMQRLSGEEASKVVSIVRDTVRAAHPNNELAFYADMLRIFGGYNNAGSRTPEDRVGGARTAVKILQQAYTTSKSMRSYTARQLALETFGGIRNIDAAALTHRAYAVRQMIFVLRRGLLHGRLAVSGFAQMHKPAKSPFANKSRGTFCQVDLASLVASGELTLQEAAASCVYLPRLPEVSECPDTPETMAAAHELVAKFAKATKKKS